MSNITYTGKNLPSSQLNNFIDLEKKVLDSVIKAKPYTARVTRDSPTAFVFLIDQSQSMNGMIRIGEETKSKADFLSGMINRLLNGVLDKCKRQNEYRNYVDISIIGYGGTDENTAVLAWEGSLEGNTFVNVNELVQGHNGKSSFKVKRTSPNGQVKEMDKWMYEWISSKAHNLTPMHDALTLAYEVLVQWLATKQNKDVYPPIVINITDGWATGTTDEDLLEASSKIKNLKTIDGNLLLYNIHLSESEEAQILFPSDPSELPDDSHARLLFDMSSDLPEIYNQEIVKITSKDMRGAYTGFAFNANLDKLVSLLNVGTNTPLRNAI